MNHGLQLFPKFYKISETEPLFKKVTLVKNFQALLKFKV